MSGPLTVLAVVAIVFNGSAGPFLVQTIAWATMLGKSLCLTGNVQRAVVETFDGAHPCCLCRTARSMAEQQQQRQQTPDKPQVPGKELLLFMRPEQRSAGVLARKGTWIGTLPEEAGLSSGRGRDDVEDPPPERGIWC